MVISPVFKKTVKTMKKNFQSPKPIWKGSVIFFTFFLLAACMQYDESLTPTIDNPNAAAVEAIEGSAAATAKRTFTAHLNAANEVNANGVDSQGQGQLILTLSKDGTAIHYKLIVANIEDITVAHIHCGIEGLNGPPVVFLFGPSAPVTVNGNLAEGTFTASDVIARPDSPACVGGLATYDDLVERLGNGTLYVNAHTPTYPGGEIRGQIH